MSLLETYQKNVLRKQEELAALLGKKAGEQKSAASISQRIQAAVRALNSTKSASVAKSKASEIQRLNAQLLSYEKKVSDIDGKIARGNKDLAAEQKKLSVEQSKMTKKSIEEARKIQGMQEKQMRSLTSTLKRHDQEIKILKALPETITVLFFASNPKDQQQLRLDEEVRNVKIMIRASKHRDSVKLESCWAVRPIDILQGINEFQPAVIHFSGHGSERDELVLMDDQQNTKLVSLDAIVQAIQASVDSVRLVFFNTCFSSNQAEAVVEHVEAAIGMATSISDEAARVFSAQFYSSISFGFSIHKSFQQAKALLMLEGITEEQTLRLYIKDGLNAEDIVIVQPPQL